MIPYRRHTLRNGLRVAVNRDPLSKLAAVNLLYCVGARDENPERTGFAHLFEHLMFRGTREVPVYDLPVQMASGEDNAFTNNDYTDFYLTLPAANVETALWLESDRMQELCITPEKLETEKRVVIEEFRQRYLNQPYGDQSMLLRALALLPRDIYLLLPGEGALLDRCKTLAAELGVGEEEGEERQGSGRIWERQRYFSKSCVLWRKNSGRPLRS